MKNTTPLNACDSVEHAHPFDFCPVCRQLARFTADGKMAKHGERYRTCKGTGMTAPSFIVSVEPVVILSVSEVA
jgi:hypothetical protein